MLKLYYYNFKYSKMITANDLPGVPKSRRDYLHSLIKYEIFDSVCHLYEQDALVISFLRLNSLCYRSNLRWIEESLSKRAEGHRVSKNLRVLRVKAIATIRRKTVGVISYFSLVFLDII